MEKLRLGFASDHRGYELKQALIDYFKKQSDIADITDYGTNSQDSCDYPDYAKLLGKELAKKQVDYAIAICGSGIGISIAMNKIKGVYCAKVNSALEANYTRVDNNTNAVAFSGNTSLKEAINIVDTFIHTPFSNLKRHQIRNDKIKEIESGQYD